MELRSYGFDVGDFRCVALADGQVDYPPQNFYANVAPEEVEAALRSHGMPTEYVTTPYSYLFVDTGTNKVMIDMGAGSLAPSTGQLLGHMQEAGIAPDQIDTVVITHAHPDHVGGALDEDGKPVFASARYFIWRREWEFWFSDGAENLAPKAHVEIARSKLEPLRDRTSLIDGEGEIHPGFTAVEAPGHTPGHLAVLVSSAGESVFYISDTVLSPLHLEHPDWLPVYDVLPDEAQTSKVRVFDMAAEDNLLVMGMHFPPFPSLGHIAKTTKGWQWKPIPSST